MQEYSLSAFPLNLWSLLEVSHLPFHLSLTEILQKDRAGSKSPTVPTRKDAHRRTFHNQVRVLRSSQARVSRSDSQTVVHQLPTAESLMCFLKCRLESPPQLWNRGVWVQVRFYTSHWNTVSIWNRCPLTSPYNGNWFPASGICFQGLGSRCFPSPKKSSQVTVSMHTPWMRKTMLKIMQLVPKLEFKPQFSRCPSETWGSTSLQNSREIYPDLPAPPATPCPPNN